MSTSETTSASFFEEKYKSAADADPWNFATSEYELKRYRTVMDALGTRRYEHAYEPGCSVGVLTLQLASICAQVDACDFSPTAVDAARVRCKDLARITIHCEALTPKVPWSKFDLVVLCEIGYYFTADAWKALVERMAMGLRPGAVLLACHWLGQSADHIQSGDAVHEAITHPFLIRTLSKRYEGFRLDRWSRTT